MMNAQMTDKIEWVVVDTNEGVWFIPNDEVGLTKDDLDVLERDFEDSDTIPVEVRDFVGGRRLMEPITIIEGWGVRSHMPGYMDCTEWTVYDTLEEAEEAFENEREENGEIQEEEDEESDDD